jgi:hypothetical protein
MFLLFDFSMNLIFKASSSELNILGIIDKLENCGLIFINDLSLLFTSVT